MKKLSMLMAVVCLMTMFTFPASVSAAQTVYYSEDMADYVGSNPNAIFSQAFPHWAEPNYWNTTAYEDAKYGKGVQLNYTAVTEATLTNAITSGQVLIRVNVKALDKDAYESAGVFAVHMSDYEITGSTTPAISSPATRASLPQASRMTIINSGITVQVNSKSGSTNPYGSSDGNVNKIITENEWHQIDTLLDFGTGKQNLYVDGEFVVESYMADVIKTNGIKSVLLSANNLKSAAENKGVVVDNLVICTPQDAFAAENVSANTAAKTVTVKFNEVIGSVPAASDITIADEAGSTFKAASVVKTDFDEITITYAKALAKNTKYTVGFANGVTDMLDKTFSGTVEFTTPAGYIEYYSEDMTNYTGWNPTIFSYRFPHWNAEGYWNVSAYEDAKYGNGIQLGSTAVVEKTLDTPITSGQVLVRANVKVLETDSYTNTGYLGVVLRSDELVTDTTLSKGTRNSAPHSKIVINSSGVAAMMNASTTGFANSEKDSDGNTVRKTITAKEWHQIDTLVDFSTEKQKLYVDGEFVVEGDLDDSIKNDGIKAVLVSADCLLSAAENKGVVVDNLKITSMKEGFMVDKLTLDKANKTVTVKFNEILDGSLDLSSANLVCGEEIISATVAKTDFDTITLTYASDLTENKTYTVEFANELSDEFGNALTEDVVVTPTDTGVAVYNLKITDAYGIEITDIDTAASDATVYVTGDVVNISGEAADATVIIATYLGSPKTLTNVSITDMEDMGYKAVIDKEFTIPEGTDVSTIKAFVWKDISAPSPLSSPCEVIFD